MSTGTVTQLVATGALDAYLSDNATHTHWKTKYNRHTRFAFESITQPFNTAVAFGAECQATVNRTGDLISYLYLNVELPGLVACDNSNSESCAGVVAGNQFPVFMAESCAPCAKNDQAALVDYLDDKFDEALPADQIIMLKKAKDKWAKEKYGAAESLDCCEEPDDCPEAVCNMDWVPFVPLHQRCGHFLVRQARIVIGGQTETILGDFMYCWKN